MKTKVMTLLLLAAGSVFAQTRFSIGVHVDAPSYYRPAPAGYGRDEYRFRESREQWREQEQREHGRGFEREHDHNFDRRGDFGRDFRR